ncbi:MAG TPA: NADH dehydrogenase FAD-containing subunit, partial [Candidatus Sumerlaeota bacterium]|nr:NADH dehydrogenase FAD-containing subunit [Candidatus Sumerlaeota bacterium]
MFRALLLIPALSAVIAFALKHHGLRRSLLVAAAAANLAAALSVWMFPHVPREGAWLGLDAPATLFTTITAILFFLASIYAYGYLKAESARGVRKDPEEGFLWKNVPEAAFTACLLLLLAAMNLTIMSLHLGMLWVAIEATTFAGAPLIYFHRHHRSLEATW